MSSYDKAAIVNSLAMIIKDTRGTFGNCGLLSELSQSLSDSLDLAEANNGYENDVVVRNNSTRNTRWYSFVSDDRVEVSRFNPLYGFGVSDKSWSGLISTLQINRTVSSVLIDLGLPTTTNKPGYFPWYRDNDQEAVPFSFYELFFKYHGIEQYLIGNTDDYTSFEVSGPTDNSRFAQIKDGFYTNTGPWSELSSHTIPDDEFHLTMPARGMDAYLKFKFRREGPFRGMVGAVLDSDYTSSFKMNAPLSSKIKLIAFKAESGWSEFVYKAGTALDRISEPRSFVDITETEELIGSVDSTVGQICRFTNTTVSGGPRSLGLRWTSGFKFGGVVSADRVTLYGTVTTSVHGSGYLIVTVGPGDREISWPGSILAESIEGQEQTGDITITEAEKAALLGSTIRSFAFGSPLVVPQQLVAKTWTYAKAQEGEIDLHLEEFQSADEASGRPALTFKQAESRIKGKSFHSWHILDQATTNVEDPGMVTLSGNMPSPVLNVTDGAGNTVYNGQASSIAGQEMERLSELIWLGSQIINSSDVAGTPSEALASALSISEAQLYVYDAVSDGAMNEFNEIAVMNGKRSPKDLGEGTFEAQCLVQYVNPRHDFGNVMNSLVGYGRVESKMAGLSSI